MRVRTGQNLPGRRMAKITFLLPQLSLAGGIRVIAEYSRELILLGHRVTIVARTPPRPRLRDVLRGGVRWRPASEPVPAFFNDLTGSVTLVSGGRRLRASDLPDADFLVATWWETVEWARDMPEAKGRLVHLMQGYEMFPWLPAARVAATYTADSLKIAVSHWVADRVQEHHRQPTAAVIHNAVDCARFGFQAERDNPLPTLGFVYRSESFKNSGLVFDLQDALAARGFPCRFLTFHSEPLPRELAARPGVTSHHRPSQALIPALYRQCDLWLFPTLEEGFGLPIIEAMACGTPVLATRAGAAPQIIRHGGNGFLAEPEAKAFADVVEAFAALAPERRRAMARDARATVESWTWADAARQLMAVLEADPPR